MLSVFPSVEICARLRFLAALLVFLLAPGLHAQTESQDQNSEPASPVPVFSVGTGFITTLEGGTPHLGPLVAPVLLVPLGQKWLIESRGTLESDLIPLFEDKKEPVRVRAAAGYLRLEEIKRSKGLRAPLISSRKN